MKFLRRSARVALWLVWGCCAIISTTSRANSSDTHVRGASVAPPEIPRQILSLYDDVANDDPFYSAVHQHAEVWLNYLGFDVVHHPLSRAFPSEAELAHTRAILTWFYQTRAVPNATAHCTWLQEQIAHGRRVIILGEPGVLNANGSMPPACLALFATLGVRYENDFADNPYFFAITHLDSDMMEFERKLWLSENILYRRYRVVRPDVRVLFEITRRDEDDSASALAWVSPRGAFVAPSLVLYEDRDVEQTGWRLNPYRFFRDALGVTDVPVPDVTTLNGRRLVYSQIDGDGILNPSHIDPKMYASEIVQRELIARYPQMPISVGLVTGYFDLAQTHNGRIMAIYRNLLASPNVEPTSHGYAHPLQWREHTLALRIPGYQFSAHQEGVTSVERVNALLQDLHIDKTATLFQLTGNCLPTQAQAAEMDTPGLLFINGGDSHYDSRHQSSAFLFGIGMRRGHMRQIYASAPNDNVYTNKWTGPFYGYHEVLQSYAHTDAPFRLKPVDIYYHFFSGEHEASISTLQKIYDTVLGQAVAPVPTSYYAQLANDFFGVHVERVNAAVTRFTQLGGLRTVRVDAPDRSVDLAHSHGVIGWWREGDHLYVHLLPDNNMVEVALQSGTAPSTTLPYLAQANGEITAWTATPQRIALTVRAWTAPFVQIANVERFAPYRITLHDHVVHQHSTIDGELRIHSATVLHGETLSMVIERETH